jgi:hypothetical protein
MIPDFILDGGKNERQLIVAFSILVLLFLIHPLIWKRSRAFFALL